MGFGIKVRSLSLVTLHLKIDFPATFLRLLFNAISVDLAFEDGELGARSDFYVQSIPKKTQ